MLPLLDGLDEVPHDRQPACAQAINAFRRERQSLPLIVASRTAHYNTLGLRLSLGAAVLIQPLTRTQTDNYLGRLGPQLAGLRQALAEKPVLWELLRTPFLLNLAVGAYQGLPAEAVSLQGSLRDRQFQLITDFVDSAVHRKSHGRRFTLTQTTHWLAFFARALGKRLETSFVVETVDISWLPSTTRRRVDAVISLVGTILLGTGIALPMALLLGPVAGVLTGFVTATATGIGMATVGSSELSQASDGRLRTLVDILIKWSFLGSALSFAMAFVAGLGGFVVGLVVALIGMFLADASFLGTLGLGGLIGAVAGVLLGAMLPAFTLDRLDRPERSRRPGNLRDTLWIGCGISIVFGVFAMALLGLGFGPLGLVSGAMIGIAAGYLYRGRALLGHWLSRILLAQAGITPLRQQAFLDFAVTHMLMLRAGGGHMFVHRLLLEYFAGLKLSNVTARYSTDGLPTADLRPEILLNRAIKEARKSDTEVVRTLTYASSVLPEAAWIPTAVKVAEILTRAHHAQYATESVDHPNESDDNPDTVENSDEQGVHAILGVHHLTATAAPPEQAATSAIEMGQILLAQLARNLSVDARSRLLEYWLNDVKTLLKSATSVANLEHASRATAILAHLERPKKQASRRTNSAGNEFTSHTEIFDHPHFWDR